MASELKTHLCKLSALTNLKKILEAAGSSLDKIVKCNGESSSVLVTRLAYFMLMRLFIVYLSDMSDYDAMNPVYVKVRPGFDFPRDTSHVLTVQYRSSCPVHLLLELAYQHPAVLLSR